MRLAEFIRAEEDAIVGEWEVFARSCLPAAASMDRLALENHSRLILTAVAADLESSQSMSESIAKSHGLKARATVETAATAHGSLRHGSGFSLAQLAAEYRALRSSVIRLWVKQQGALMAVDLADIIRFDEAIDEALAESIETYAKGVERANDLVLGILGHEIRTPLSVIYSNVEILQGQRADDELVASVAKRIERNASAITVMANDLVDFVHAKMGSPFELHPTEVDFGLACREALEDCTSVHRPQGISIHTEGDLNGFWDAHRIGQVLRNLIRNAIEHGASNERVEIVASGAGDKVSLTVTNMGSEIPPEVLPGIFEPLARFRSASHLGTNGHHLGLGLYIVREIVTAHGGHVSVESSKARTAFSVVLPRRFTRADARPAIH